MDQIRQNEGQRALAWLDQYWSRQQRVCPICQNNNWSISTPVEMRTFNGGDLIIGGAQGGLMPAFTVMCTTCGYLHMFSALHSGVVDMNEYSSRTEPAQQ